MSERRFESGRHAGALVPLFSIPSRSSWGVGEIADIPRFAQWLSAAGLDFLQILPVNEMADGQSSPYSALSAMAIDPIFIAVSETEDFAATGGVAALSEGERRALDEVRAARQVPYAAVRALKSSALRAAFARFEHDEWRTGSRRAAALRDFAERESWWLKDYALFRALRQENGGRYWLEWPEGQRRRAPEALAEARQRLDPEIRYRGWLQWIADEQWQRARRDSGPVGIFGDFPFVVGSDSGDVWARQHEFRIDASVGTPPDAFSETGQDWGLPVYRWEEMEAGGYEWLRQRVARYAELYDGFRVDHLIGFYRMFVRERNGRSGFVPPDEPSQIAQGERLLRLIGAGGRKIIAEDLGIVPDFMRDSLARLQVPGFKVLRWERDWQVPGQPFRDPASFPAVSIATSGTHDTDGVADWWDTAPRDERERAAELGALRAAGIGASEPFGPTVRDALLEALFDAGSDLLIVPVQDIFGWRDRINTPAVVDDVNWTWRLPWPVEELLSRGDGQERAAFVQRLARTHRR
ncbi:MAG: 4-alpha-glucanotransferase [Acidobacteriota bacterium]